MIVFYCGKSVKRYSTIVYRTITRRFEIILEKESVNKKSQYRTLLKKNSNTRSTVGYYIVLLFLRIVF